MYFHSEFVFFTDIKSGQGYVGLSQEPQIYVESYQGDDVSDPNSGHNLPSTSPRVVNGSINGSVNGETLQSLTSGSTRPYPSLVEERLDNISDNMSYMSLEVNTTGTGSVRVS